MSVALLRQRAALDPGSSPVELSTLTENIKLLARKIVEDQLDSKHVQSTMLRWLARVETIRLSRTNKAPQNPETNMDTELLYRAITLGYKHNLGPLAWSDMDFVESLLVLEESCLQYLQLVEDAN